LEGLHVFKMERHNVKPVFSRNLDIKNPHVGELESHDSEELLVKYRNPMAEVAGTREALKKELIACFGKGK